MDENQQIDSKESNSQNKRIIPAIGDYILSSTWKAVVVFAVIGYSISNTFRLTMNSETWFWFFSSIAQTFAALVALVAIFLISRLDLYNAKINNYIQMIRNLIPEFRNDLKPDYLTVDELVITHADEIIRSFESKNPNNVLSVENIPKHLIRQGLYVAKARADIDKLKQKKEHAKKQMWILLEHTVFIIILSILLLPFGSLTTEDSSILTIWIDYKLKWVLIFGVSGICLVALHKIKYLLNDILSEKE